MERPVALVTGSSSGIGLETVIAFAQEGYHVIATMRDLSKQDALIERVQKIGVAQQIQVMPLDVTQPQAAQQLAEQVWREHQRLDVLVNNAGIAVTGAAEEIKDTEWTEQFDTNFFGVVYVTKAFLPYLRKQRSGRLINLSSGAAFVGSPFTSPYTASKCAVEGFSESLRLELLSFGIEVVLVEPGFYQTKILKQMARVSANSPYARYDKRVQSFVGRFSHRAKSPQFVAKKIVTIAKTRHPRMRYICGSDARLLYLIKRMLPFAWIEWVFRRIKS